MNQGALGWMMGLAMAAVVLAGGSAGCEKPTEPAAPSGKPAEPVEPVAPAASGGKPTVYDAWPFDGAEAKRRPQETAKALGVPEEKTVDLGGGVKLELVLIPAGEFLMGSPANEAGRWDNEGPQHKVRITKPFYMGKHEVTQEQWERLMGNNPSYFKGAKHPVDTVSWNDTQEFLKRLNARIREEDTFRLPTEAEWEYACRAGTSTRFYSGDNDGDLDAAGWHSANSGRTTHPVGGKRPNAFGLYDMHGNVWEWCADRFAASYPGGERVDPSGPATGLLRVLRGGSWSNGPKRCRSARRYGAATAERNDYDGFRVAVSAGVD